MEDGKYPVTIVTGYRSFMGDLFLGAVGVENGGILQLTNQILLDRVDIDSSELIAFRQFLGGQSLGLVFCGQFVNSGDDFIHVHAITSYISMYCNGNAVFFGFSVDGQKLDLA